MSTGGVSRYLGTAEFAYDPAKMTPVHWLTLVLAAVTGSVHVYLWYTQGFLPFLFAAVVFYGAVVAGLFNIYRKAIYALGIPFTAGQIVAWVALGTPDFYVGLADKAVQVVLIVLLVYLFRNENELVGA